MLHAVERSELWTRARDDAGFTDDEAEWLELPGAPEDPVNGTWAAYAGKGAHLDAAVMDLGTDQQRWSRDRLDKVRVFTSANVSDAAALGLMRWALEYARLERNFNPAVRLIRLTHVAHQKRIIAAGPGGAVYHHASPEQQQSDAAAAALVRSVFGPQLGQLNSTFGPLFREAEVLPDEVFTRRAVAFAAFHDEDLSRYEAENGVGVQAFVGAVGDAAVAWRTTLLSDDEFNRLRGAAPVVVPDVSETTAAGGAASALWRTPTDLYERAERRALELLAAAP
jgi:hypothetical protein